MKFKHKSMFTIREFYQENGKSLVMPYSHYWDDVCIWRTHRKQNKAFDRLYRKLHRINKWHKKDLIKSRNKRSPYCASIIWDAKFPLP